MILLSLLALLLIGSSVVLVMRALALPKLRSGDRLRAIEYYGFRAPSPAVAEAPAGPAFGDLAGRIGEAASRRFGTARVDALRRELVVAGFYRLTPAAFVGYRVLAASVFGIGVAVAVGTSSAMLAVLYAGLAALFGWFLPLGVLRRAGRHRLDRIDRELPDVLDMIVVTVEAGLTLSASLQLACQKFEGPLSDELRLTLQEQRMGRSLHDALVGMLGRCDTPNVRSFVRSVTQGESLGVSIGTIMSNLAVEMRKRRRAAAEKQAQKAPVKILFPLVFLILPAFLLIILAPPVIQLFESFGK